MMQQNASDPWEEDYKPATPWDDYKPVTPIPTHVRNRSPISHPHPDASHLHPECFRNEDGGCPCNWNDQGGMDCEGTICCPYCNRQVRGCKRCGYVDPCDCPSSRNIRNTMGQMIGQQHQQPPQQCTPPQMLHQHHPHHQGGPMPFGAGIGGNPMQIRSNLIPVSAQTTQQCHQGPPPPGMEPGYPGGGPMGPGPQGNGFCGGQCIHDQGGLFSPQMMNNGPPPPQMGMMNSNPLGPCGNGMPQQPPQQCFNQPINGQMIRCNRPNCTTCYPNGFTSSTPTQGPMIGMPMQGVGPQQSPNMFQPPGNNQGQPMSMCNGNMFPMSSMQQSPLITCQMPGNGFEF